MRTIFPSTNGATTRSLKPRATRSRPSARPVRSATASALTTWRPQDPLVQRQTCIRLNRRFRSADAFTIEPRPIEAANASLPGSEHRAGIVDPARASLGLLGGGDPLDPVSARDGRDVRPQRPRFRGGRERLPQICRHLGFRGSRVEATAETAAVRQRSSQRQPTWMPRARRLRTNVPLRYRGKNLHTWYEGMIQNISQSGVLFHGPQQLPANALVELIFEMPEEISGQKNSNVLCQARLIRVKDAVHNT